MIMLPIGVTLTEFGSLSRNPENDVHQLGIALNVSGSDLDKRLPAFVFA